MKNLKRNKESNHVDLLSSVHDVGETTTQVWHFKDGIVATQRGLLTKSIKEGKMMKIKDTTGRMFIINTTNILYTEVFEENGD